MPQVIAWQCPHTAKLFADKATYQKHLATLRRERLRQRKIDRLKAAFEEKCRELRRAADFNQIARWLEDHAEILAAQNDRHERSRKPFPPVTITNVVFTDMRWGECRSNTHCAPFGGVINWERDPSKPEGYPGYRGHIEFTLENFKTFSSKILDGTGIWTGSGRGGKLVCYDVTLFDADWPNLRLMEKMRGDI